MTVPAPGLNLTARKDGQLNQLRGLRFSPHPKAANSKRSCRKMARASYHLAESGNPSRLKAGWEISETGAVTARRSDVWCCRIKRAPVNGREPIQIRATTPAREAGSGGASPNSTPLGPAFYCLHSAPGVVIVRLWPSVAGCTAFIALLSSSLPPSSLLRGHFFGLICCNVIKEWGGTALTVLP